MESMERAMFRGAIALSCAIFIGDVAVGIFAATQI
jgi:hypothetical protein